MSSLQEQKAAIAKRHGKSINVVLVDMALGKANYLSTDERATMVSTGERGKKSEWETVYHLSDAERTDAKERLLEAQKKRNKANLSADMKTIAQAIIASRNGKK